MKSLRVVGTTGSKTKDVSYLMNDTSEDYSLFGYVEGILMYVTINSITPSFDATYDYTH
jgi:hypothetical protein